MPVKKKAAVKKATAKKVAIKKVARVSIIEPSEHTKHAAVQTSRADADVYYIDEATRRRVEGSKK